MIGQPRGAIIASNASIKVDEQINGFPLACQNFTMFYFSKWLLIAIKVSNLFMPLLEKEVDIYEPAQTTFEVE